MGGRSPRELDRRREILEAALRVFAERGFRGATIKELAREAGIRSSALIYWYFEYKDNLFRAILAEFSPVVRRAADPAELMDRTPEEVLTLIAGSFLETFDEPTTARLFRITLSATATDPGEIGPAFGEAQKAVLGFVASYLQRQIELGRLRAHDPRNAARSFLGALIVYVPSREVFSHLSDGLPDRERYAKDVVGIFLNGLRAP